MRRQRRISPIALGRVGYADDQPEAMRMEITQEGSETQSDGSWSYQWIEVQVMPNLRDAYAISNAAHDFPMHDLHRIGLDVVYWLELFIQVPLSVVVIWLYAKRSPARPVVEAFLCALHFAGTSTASRSTRACGGPTSSVSWTT